MSAKIFCLMADVSNQIIDGKNYIDIRLEYDGALGKALIKLLHKLCANKKRKLIEISDYPSEKCKAAFKLWHGIIGEIVKQCGEKKIEFIFNTKIPVEKENIKRYLKAQYGYSVPLFEIDGRQYIEIRSSKTFNFEEMIAIIQNTIQYANDNDVSVQEYLDEYQRLMKGDINDKNS